MQLQHDSAALVMYKGGDCKREIALDMLQSVHFKICTGLTSESVWLSGETSEKQPIKYIQFYWIQVGDMMQFFPINSAYIHYLLIIDYFYCLGENAFEMCLSQRCVLELLLFLNKQSNKQKTDEIIHTEENQHVWEMWTSKYFAFVFDLKGPGVSRQTWNVILGK